MARKDLPAVGGGLGGFEALYPEPAPSSPEPSPSRSPQESGADGPHDVALPPKAQWGGGRSRRTRSFSLTLELFERIQRCAHAKGVTLSDVAEIALTKAMDRAEDSNGGPFPPVPEVERKSLDDL